MKGKNQGFFSNFDSNIQEQVNVHNFKAYRWDLKVFNVIILRMKVWFTYLIIEN